MAAGFQEKARRPRNAVEPVAAGVYFASEAYKAACPWPQVRLAVWPEAGSSASSSTRA
jgi:hypothetical protein